MPGTAAKVDEPTFRQQDDVSTRREREAVDLWLDVDVLLGVLLEPRDVDLYIKVTDAASQLDTCDA